MDNFVYLLLLLFLGKLSSKLPFPENTPQVLNQYVIWISFPATVLLKLNGLAFDPSLLVLALVPWTLVFLSGGGVILISRVLGWDRPLTGAVMLSVALGNTSFFGYPAVAAFLGEENLKYAILYDQLGSFLALATFGTIVMSVYGRSTKISVKMILLRIVCFPPFSALVLGLLLARVPIPPTPLFMLKGLSSTLVPLVIFSVGSQLRFCQPLSSVGPILITMGLKMIVSPIIALGLLMGLGISGPVFQVAIFEAAMPSMVMAGILAAAGNLRADVANAAIGYGILLSFVTLPLLYWLIGTG
ncbi:MAG: AEC family transporter [Desulfobacteraceae bacterium]|nr:AEC family transporter [Desulfobacteraceae bacterium]